MKEYSPVEQQLKKSNTKKLTIEELKSITDQFDLDYSKVETKELVRLLYENTRLTRGDSPNIRKHVVPYRWPIILAIQKKLKSMDTETANNIKKKLWDEVGISIP